MSGDPFSYCRGHTNLTISALVIEQVAPLRRLIYKRRLSCGQRKSICPIRTNIDRRESTSAKDLRLLSVDLTIVHRFAVRNEP